MLHSLPPILCIRCQNPMLNYSKALRGLSVLSRVMCIFTHTTISPGPLLRQYPNHYAIRAGRNLPDKEFRYLRTVIVTAAVHRGLSSVLLFSAASFEALLIPKLRSHFAEFLNKGSPARLRILSSPTCVGLRYGRLFAP